MKDTLSHRIRRIITGTASTIVTKLEGLAPEAFLEQAIHEVDEALREVRAELGRVLAQKHAVTKALSKLNHEHEALEDQVTLAYKADKPDLVEAALTR